MSRSRRKFRLTKCICGRHLIPYLERRWRYAYECTVLQYVHERNNEFLRYRRRQAAQIANRGRVGIQGASRPAHSIHKRGH